jgi:hypothetical protein
MSRLRDLINIKTQQDIEGSAGPIDGEQFSFQTTCYDVCENNYHNNCCVAFIVPAGVSCVTAEVWGGGGGGAGTVSGCNPEMCSFGPPGGAGAYVVRCLNNVSEADRFDFVVGNANNCAFGCQGCHGCFSCVCGPDTQLCAQGGGNGFAWCNWGTGNMCCSENNATAYGGDINIDGKPGKYCSKCVCTDGWRYDQIFIPYPGGINNLCGGWVQQAHENSSSCVICNYEIICKAGEMLEGLGSSSSFCHGYIPGMGHASWTHFCECQCYCNCECGGPGNPGMVRITYK